MGAISFDAVKMIALARQQRVPRLDLQFYPHLPRAMLGALTRAVIWACSQSGTPATGWRHEAIP
jgi:hypothetical protein